MNILDYLINCQTIGVSGHIRPDGDCVGSCLGMALYLKKALPEARVDVFLGDFSASLRDNMFGLDLIRRDYESEVNRYDAFLCLDCDQTRLGDAQDYFQKAALKVNIDHHVSNAGGCGDLNYVVPEASSACELVYDAITGAAVFTAAAGVVNGDGSLRAQNDINGEGCSRAQNDINGDGSLRAQNDICVDGSSQVHNDAIENRSRQAVNAPEIDAEIAQNLYIGMVTDTGIFKYSNTSRKTMETAGKLMEYGFDFSRIVREVYDEKTYTQQQIMGRALLESIRILDGRCIFSVISRKTMQFYKATSVDLEGIAAQLLLTKGVDCSVFLYEMQPMNYKISLRSNGAVDVAKVAGIFGGGGHMRAAGCTVNAQWRDIINHLTAEIEKQF